MREISSLQLNIETLARELISLASEKKITFGTAESCTGGLIASYITDISGASAVFWGGIVSYDNSVKMGLLGVREETLLRVGPVSHETAEQMASGAVKALGVDYAVAVTGFAGPGSAVPKESVGLVYAAIASANRKVSVTENHFEGDRKAVRLQTVEKALSMLLDHVKM